MVSSLRPRRLLVLALLAPGLPLPGKPLAVENLRDGDTVRNSVVLLRGTAGADDTGVEVAGKAGNGKPLVAKGLVQGGRFKILVGLSPGRNELAVAADHSQAPVTLTLTYEPATNPHHVRLIWLADKTGATDYATPGDGDPQNYAERLRTAGLLLQCFTAERMNELGYGRRTFSLETDEKGRVVVHTIKAPEEAAHYQQMKDDQLFWREVGQFLNTAHPDPLAKNMVLAAFTRKDPATGRMMAHTALGGGNLGLFGSASVFSWPDSIAGAQAAFLDDRKVDPARVHEDSAGRGTYWAVASTTLGATLHEMGHTFGLPHCKDPRCIMTRGFDRLNRFFVFEDRFPGKPPKTFPPDQEGYFSPVSASYLRWSPWFQPDSPPPASPSRPKITLDEPGKRVVFSSAAGLRWLGFWEGPDIRTFREFRDDAPPEITLTLEEITALMGGKTATKVVAMDGTGQTRELRLGN